MLGRKRDEAIEFTIPPSLVEQRISVVVCDIRSGGQYGAKVRLGIEAPRDITVHRKEVQDEIDRHRPE